MARYAIGPKQQAGVNSVAGVSDTESRFLDVFDGLEPSSASLSLRVDSQIIVP